MSATKDKKDEAVSEAVVSLEEATRLLGISKPTLYRWLDEGRIKGMKAGRQWRFYEKDVRAVLEDAGEVSEALKGLRAISSGLTQGVSEDEQAEIERLMESVDKRSPDSVAETIFQIVCAQAVFRKAYGVLLEPERSGLRIRFRDARAWWEVARCEVPLAAVQSLTQAVKRITRMDVNETRVPQDGRGWLTLYGREVDVRTSTFPGLHGEGVCMRIFDPESLRLPSLNEIGFTVSDANRIGEIVHGSDGVVLVVGGAGTGKTTLLYSMLNEINTPERHIMTVEDPVEIDLPGITQAHLNHAAGVTFPKALIGIFRHEPDVVMVGEIRDHETLDIICKGGLSGRLMLSTVNTKDVFKGITRVRDFGVPDFLIADAVRAIISPRLLGVLCPECKESYQPDPELLRRFGVKDDTTFYTGKGCDACHGTGFSGVAAIYEVLFVDDPVRELIKNGASERDIKKAALAHGMNTFEELALKAARDGVTSLEEAAKALK